MQAPPPNTSCWCWLWATRSRLRGRLLRPGRMATVGHKRPLPRSPPTSAPRVAAAALRQPAATMILLRHRTARQSSRCAFACGALEGARLRSTGVEGALRCGGPATRREGVPACTGPARRCPSVRGPSRPLHAFRDAYVIPAGLARCHLQGGDRRLPAPDSGPRALPPEERFTIEHVTNKSWGGYNWYQADTQRHPDQHYRRSADRAIDLACHEGYPGHHVTTSRSEGAGPRSRLPEYQVYPSRQSLIAEGTANYGTRWPSRRRNVWRSSAM